MNLTFCGSQPGNLVGDYWFNWPVSQWMARLKVSHGDLYAQAAVYQVNRANLGNKFLNFNFKRGSGVLVWQQSDWKIEQYVLSITVPNEQMKAVKALLEGGHP